MFDVWAPEHSVLREKVIEHIFLAELSRSLLLDLGLPFEVLRSELDAFGYDLVIEANGIMRHVQLKAGTASGTRSHVDVQLALADKPGGCVVWILVDPQSLRLDQFLWFGGRAGEPLPPLGDRRVRHSRGNAEGTKNVREGLRRLPKGEFSRFSSMRDLAIVMFGGEPGAGSALLTERWIGKTAHPVGVYLTQPPPEMRYQLLQGRLHTLQRFPSGAVARGEIDSADAGFPLQAGDGWYDGNGRFLGDDPAFPDWD